MSSPDQEDIAEVERVFDALQVYVDRINALLCQVEGNPPPRFIDEDLLKADTQALKDDIKEAKKRGTIDGRKLPKSELEYRYFGYAIGRASARFMLRANTRPTHPSWASGLRDVQEEFLIYVHRLEQQYPQVALRPTR